MMFLFLFFFFSSNCSCVLVAFVFLCRLRLLCGVIALDSQKDGEPWLLGAIVFFPLLLLFVLCRLFLPFRLGLFWGAGLSIDREEASALFLSLREYIKERALTALLGVGAESCERREKK